MKVVGWVCLLGWVSTGGVGGYGGSSRWFYLGQDYDGEGLLGVYWLLRIWE